MTQKAARDAGVLSNEGAGSGIFGLIQRSLEWRRRSLNPAPEHEEGLKRRDHRSMIGGNWDLLGRLQFDFMVSRGLEPRHVLLDLGCGSFRAGRYFIPYLGRGNYLGMDKQRVLVEEGRKHEISQDLWYEKSPEIVVSDKFDVVKFSRKADFVLAQSLLTHLSKRDVLLCLKALRVWAKKETVVYASVCEAAKPIIYTLPSHSSRDFYYTRRQLSSFARTAGWSMEYIGDWGHPHPYTRMIKLTTR